MFALVDCNNFYASCERIFKPALENKPIVVLSNNDGCIIARSNEAKKLGIPMGAPFFKWEKICFKNKVHVFSSNYELYGDMSHRVMTILAENCSTLEVYSIDEAFLFLNSLSDTQLFDYALSLRKKIKTYTGLPTSIGMGTTKTLAKIANAIAKNDTSDGVFLFTDKNLSYLKKIPVEKIWGIGHSLSIKLKDFNIHTAFDLKNSPPKLLRKKFSVNMEKIIYELNGVACLKLDIPQPRKQIISSRSFGKKIENLNDLEEAISNYTFTAAAKLRKQYSLASGMIVFLCTNHFKKNELQYENNVFFPFPHPTADTGYIIRIAKKCIRHLYKKQYHYHKVGLILMDLIPCEIEQLDFLNSHSAKPNILMQTIDSINSEYGKNTIFYCAQGIKRDWQMKSKKCSARYTTRWNELARVLLKKEI
jgi:DNA polymerase V